MSETVELHRARVGHDPELKEYNGREYVTFSVAVNENSGGKKITKWFEVHSDNKKLVDLIEKGSLLYVRGRRSEKIGKNGKTYVTVYANSFSDVVPYTFKKGDVQVAEERSGSDEGPPF